MGKEAGIHKILTNSAFPPLRSGHKTQLGQDRGKEDRRIQSVSFSIREKKPLIPSPLLVADHGGEKHAKW